MCSALMPITCTHTPSAVRSRPSHAHARPPGTPWLHHWEECVGSGHAALTVRADWRAHLTRCARELGVKRTRFHGLLDDDFDISLSDGSDDYVNLDSLVDFHASIGE
jgi:xylan 1,4-beta-xylosidase